MKETKPYWYHNTAYSMEQYFVRLNFPNLLKDLYTLDMCFRNVNNYNEILVAFVRW